MATDTEKELGHRIIAQFFEPKVRDMGAGLRIVELTPGYIKVETRDLIVKAVREYISD